MDARALLDALVALAEEEGLRVRVLPRGAGGGDGVPLARSGTCRIRGELWLVLAAGEPLEDRIEAAADALRRHGGPVLAGRWLPPAVRRRLEPEGG